ncbi:MAG: hypothetical protein HY443_00640 [Candidatus Nealsonbacteria bacterium]|nr:hypothetical protein [Candidatus Nealsonbacteria bacterium]
MWTKYLISFFAALFLAAAGSFALGQPADIQYPVAELGNCQDESSCRSFCDQPENLSACLDFAKKNNLMSEEELAMAEKFEASGGTGPGGCSGKDSCENYCNDISHIDECIAFAEENDLMPPEELAEAKKVQAAIARGVQPPPCGNKDSCDIYCEEPSHMEECISFAAAAGLMDGKELADAQKMLQAIRRGVTPPPCRGKDACEEYCAQPDNMESCMNFAMEAGFMSEEEKEGAQKMLAALKKGVKPLPCRGKDECDQYCGQDEHLEECMNFAIEAGFMSEEDAVMARKTGGKGPGGCRGKEECESFCSTPENQETCFNFAKDNGLMSEEDLKQIEDGKRQIQESFNQMPPEVLDCLISKIGADRVEGLRLGTAMPSREIGDSMQACFQEMGAGPQMGPSADTMMRGGGPGGCQTPEECQAYCQQNPEECQNFAPPAQHPEGELGEGEIMPPKQIGPGGCQSEEECQAYCAANPEACGAPPPGSHPDDGQGSEGSQGPPSEEEMDIIRRQMEEQARQQMEEEIRRRMEEQMRAGTPPAEGTPPPEGERPQSIIDKTQNFLGSIISIFQKR